MAKPARAAPTAAASLIDARTSRKRKASSTPTSSATNANSKSHPSTTTSHSVNPRAAKRARFQDARKILAQVPDRALNKNGELDVAGFVKAREFEMRALGKSMHDSKRVLRTRAFQQVPRDLRRRTASHNVRRIPRRLRARAAREMKDDRTPTGKARLKKATTQQRLRREKGNDAKVQAQAKKIEKKKAQTEQQAGGKEAAAQPRPDAPKKNTLAKSARIQRRFRRRQIHKCWLPSHLWHAKRAHMSATADPLWRFAVPLTPTEKCFRTTHRAANMRGCVAWDTSYMSTIALEGTLASLLGLARAVGVAEAVLTGTLGSKWRRGTRTWSGWIRERDRQQCAIAPVVVIMAPEAASATDQQTAESKRVAKRKMFVRVHPSAFFQVWNELLKVAKIQRPQVTVEDLRFEIGSIEVTGPGSSEALVAALQPYVAPKEAAADQNTNGGDDDWEDMETPAQVWSMLGGLTNPAAAPPSALLAFDVSDPRLRHPPRTQSSATADANAVLETLSAWPVDETLSSAGLFDSTARHAASRRLASQKAINGRKGAAAPGEYPPPLPSDPQIPVLMYTSRTVAATTNSSQASWTVLLPWSCVLPVWYTLMHYPLSTGGKPRFGCLQEQIQHTFEQEGSWFPGDFPGTQAGWGWEARERERARREWARQPKGRRVEYARLKLGEGKGEVGKGWACDWESLLQHADDHTGAEAKASQTRPDAKAVEAAAAAEHDPCPVGLHQHFSSSSLSKTTSVPSVGHGTGLTAVRITLLSKGSIARCARIYRLPLDSTRRRAWLDLASYLTASTGTLAAVKGKAGAKRAAAKGHVQADAKGPRHERRAALAQSLLTPSSAAAKHTSVQAGLQCPGAEDLVGFITTANLNMHSGKSEGNGNIILSRILRNTDESEGMQARESGKEKEKERERQKEKEREKGKGSDDSMHTAKHKGEDKGKDKVRGFCVVRNAGETTTRLARWTLLPL